MGTNAGPQLADVYQHEFEYDYIHKLIENKDEVSLRKLKDIFRYQDDLLVVNDDKLFGNVMNDIYPKEMVINNTNISPCKCNYLDLTISIYKGQFLVKLYDKRKDYSFKVISYPHLDGNIPCNQSYGVFTSQLVRFCRVNTSICGYIQDVKELVAKLINQGFDKAALRNRFNRFCKGKISTWGKYGVDLNTYIDKIFD